MADESEVLHSYPVVMYRRAQGSQGWMFRKADDDEWHGPFADRDAAIAFGLETMSQAGGASLSKSSVRRAA